MESIVVGIDGSKGAQGAARWAASYAARNDARIVAVHAVPRTGLWSLSALQVDIAVVLDELQTLLDGRWTAALRAAKVSYNTQLVRGDPAIELLRIAKRTRAGLLVLGSKSHSGLADLVVGGTVHKVMNRSTVPVVLVPSPPKSRTG